MTSTSDGLGVIEKG